MAEKYIDVEKKIEEMNMKIESITKLIENRPYDEEAKLMLREFKYSLAELIDTPTVEAVEVKKIETIRDDLKWWLETNSEKGVVHIPKYFVENIIAKMDGGK